MSVWMFCLPREEKTDIICEKERDGIEKQIKIEIY